MDNLFYITHTGKIVALFNSWSDYLTLWSNDHLNSRLKHIFEHIRTRSFNKPIIKIEQFKSNNGV